MIRTLLIGVFFAMSVSALEHEITFENSNFTLSRALIDSGERVLVNYNRFRIIDHLQEGAWFVTAIGDLENYLGRGYIQSTEYRYFSASSTDTPFKTQTERHNYGEGEYYAQLYRLYGGYVDEKHRIALGLQKVSMGVGRIWNPTDLFNPKNPLALEPDEVYGAFALAYTYASSQLSELTAVAAQREDSSFKYAGRLKGYLEVVDIGLDVVSADDVTMIGYELEGELFGSGIEVRSEGGWFEDKGLNEEFFQAIVGADYAFENSLMLVGEWLHSSKTFDLAQREESGLRDNLMGSYDYLGISAGYEFDALLYGSLFGMVSMDDESFYLSPFIDYSLADDMTLGIGAMLYAGESGTEFGDLGQTYYLNFKVTF